MSSRHAATPYAHASPAQCVIVGFCRNSITWLGVGPDRQHWLSEAMETFGRAVAGQRDHANGELGNAAAADMLNYFEQALVDRAEHPRRTCSRCWPPSRRTPRPAQI
jgi:hypothetical protein